MATNLPPTVDGARPSAQRLLLIVVPVIVALAVVAVLLFHFAGGASGNPNAGQTATPGGNQAVPGGGQDIGGQQVPGGTVNP